MHETVFKDRFKDRTLSIGNAHHGHDLGLHIRWEPWVRQGLDCNRLEFSRSHDAHVVDSFFNGTACLTEFGNERFHMFAQDIFHLDVPLSHGTGHHIGSSFDAVGDDNMLTALHAFHPIDMDGRRTCTAHLSSHHIDVVGKVNDFRFLGCIFNDGRAFGHGSRHHKVFRRSNTGEIKVDGRSHKSVRSRGLNTAMTLFNPCSQRLKAFQMDINGTRPNGAAPGQRNLGFSHTGKK